MDRDKAVERSRRLFELVKTGKTVFFKAGDTWDIIGPADQIKPGEPVTVTKSDGTTSEVIVLTIMAERTVDGFATRTATFRNAAPAAVPTADTGRRWYPVADKQAAAVGGMLGLTSSAKLGYCHYCGIELNRNGYCDECR